MQSNGAHAVLLLAGKEKRKRRKRGGWKQRDASRSVPLLPEDQTEPIQEIGQKLAQPPRGEIVATPKVLPGSTPSSMDSLPSPSVQPVLVAQAHSAADTVAP